MSVLSESDEGTVAGLSDAGHLRTKKDKDGNIINGNQQQMIWAARRQGQMKSRKTEDERRQKDADFMAAWAPNSVASNLQSPSQTFYNAAQVVIILGQAYSAAANDETFHVDAEHALDEHDLFEFLEHPEAA